MSYLKVLLIFGCVITISQVARADSLFKKMTFSVRSVVDVIKDNIATKIVVDEAYSNWQRRARLTVKTFWDIKNKKKIRNETVEIDYIADLNSNQTIIAALSDETPCQTVSTKDLFEAMKLDFIDSLTASKSVNDLILGPMRLAYIVNNNMNKLQLVSSKQQTILKNVPCFEHELKLKRKSGSDLSLIAYFPMEHPTEDSLPIAILIVLHKSLIEHAVIKSQIHKVMIEYSHLGPLELDTAEASFHHKQLSGQELYHDRFIFKPMSSCSKVLNHQSVKLFHDKPENFTNFAFNSKVKHNSYVNYNSFVAYSGKIQSMRVDEMDIGAANASSRRQLFNFGSNRLYHFLDRNSISKDDTESKKILNFHSVSQGSPLDKDCVVAQIAPRRWSKQLSIAYMLTGSEDFVYLGRAMVRGISSLVYEALNEPEMPYWLEQGDTYNGENSTLLWRSSQAHYKRSTKLSIKTVIYVSETERTPIMIDIFGVYVDPDSRESIFRVYERWRAHIYDFAWDLVDEAPNGDKPFGMFTVNDESYTGTLDEVELLLMRPESKPGIDLKSNFRQRDISIMGSLQNSLELPASMVHDFESHVVDDKDGKEVLLVRFRLAERIPTWIRLYYITELDSVLGTFPVQSFHKCYMLAAHYRTNQHFGYDPHRKLCTISPRAIRYDQKGAPNEPALDGFTDLTVNGNKFEVYRIMHEKDESRNILITKWTEGTMSSDLLLGHSLTLYESEKVSSIFKIEHAQWKRIHSSKGENASILHGIVEGYGFVDSDPTSKTSGLVRVEHSETVAGNLDQCRTACILEPSCRSYSVCVEGIETECILSIVKFTPNMMNQLKSMSKKMMMIQSDNSISINIKKQFGCEIHNKHYLDLFDPPVKTNIDTYSLSSFDIKPVAGREQCAEQCFLSTLASTSSKLMELTNTKTSTIKDEDHDNRKKILTETDVCHSFRYVGSRNLKNLPPNSRNTALNRLGANSNDTVADGYCLFFKSSNEVRFFIEENAIQIEAEVIDAKGRFFYQPQHGVQLKASLISKKDQSAVFNVIQDGGNTKDLSLFNSFIQRGDNWQVGPFDGTIEDCAKICLLQRYGQMPSCRSFDVSVVESRRVCYLNSISLTEALANNRSDLIRRTADGVQVWHYEPINDLVLYIADSELNRISSSPNIIQRNAPGYPVFSFLIVFLAIVSGICATVILIKRFSTTKNYGPRLSVGSINILVDGQELTPR